MELILKDLTVAQLVAIGIALEPPAPAEYLPDVAVDEAGVMYVEGVAPEPTPDEEKVAMIPGLAKAVPAPAPPYPGTDLDSAGNAWDAAIHSANKSKVKDGTWRIKRNSGAATPPPQVQQPSPAVTYQDVMLTITQNISTGLITPVAVSELLAEYGINSTAELMNHETRWGEIRAHVVRLSGE